MRREADRASERGLTFIELIATATVLAILASAVLPLASAAMKRQREIELRRTLRDIRTAVDRYKEDVDRGLIGGTDVKLGSEGYPPTLEVLVEGVSRVGAVDKKLKYLRRIPEDPMTRKTEWDMRCYQDEPDSTSWCGQNVWDVRSNSHGKALDGSRYDEW